MKKFWRWVCLHWKKIGAAILGAAAILVVATSARAVIARLKQIRRWKWVPDDPNSILIRDDDHYVQVRLPRGVIIDQVTGAGISSTGDWAVEVKHAATDRSGDPARGSGSDLGL